MVTLNWMSERRRRDVTWSYAPGMTCRSTAAAEELEMADVSPQTSIYETKSTRHTLSPRTLTEWFEKMKLLVFLCHNFTGCPQISVTLGPYA